MSYIQTKNRFINLVRVFVKDYSVGLCIDPVTAFSDCIEGSRYGGNGSCYIVLFSYRERQPSTEEQLTAARLRIENLLVENIKLKQSLKDKENDRLTSSLLIAMEIRIRELEDIINSLNKDESTVQESCIKKVRFS